jgi:putative heme-binding domain-containing protein
MSRLAVVLAVLAITVAPLAAQRGAGAGSPAAAVPPAGGDPARGKTLVESNKCLDCHRIGETGSRVGPVLSNIGAVRTAGQLAESIVDPDAQVLPENRFVRVTMKDGTTVTGRLLNQDAFTIQLLTQKEELQSVQKASLREYAILDKGLMASYRDAFTPQQLDDVVSYLASLKGAMPARGGARP